MTDRPLTKEEMELLGKVLVRLSIQVERLIEIGLLHIKEQHKMTRSMGTDERWLVLSAENIKGIKNEIGTLGRSLHR